MRKLLIVALVVAVSTATISFSIFSDQLATAKPQSKIQFTKTVTSSPDPATGKGQLALILSPNRGSIYAGSLTYTANQPVEVVVLHELGRDDSKGQPTWSVDRNTVYGISALEPAKTADSVEFTGAALGFRSAGPFTVTVSVDGWIRGQPTEVMVQTFEAGDRSFTLPDSHVKVTLSMHSGFFGKDSVYYIITDSSNKTLAERIADKQGAAVQFAPKLRWAPAASQDPVYMFTNGIKGDGLYGFQGEVFASTPAQPEKYSPLRSVSLVSWKNGQKPQVLDSADDVLKAARDSRVKITNTNVTINAPQISWPGGQMLVKNVTNASDASFDKGQVTEIDRDSKKVTFIAHRAWGADGRTLYYIVTDATPTGPAQVIGVPAASKIAQALSSPVFSDMYQFKNGIKGAGPLGFQQSVIDVKPDESYAPLCRVSIAEWKNEGAAMILETMSDIDSKKSDGSIFVTLARPLSSDHVINCPVIDLPKR